MRMLQPVLACSIHSWLTAIVISLGQALGLVIRSSGAAAIRLRNADPGGMVTVPARACVAIPAVLRRRCGLRAGDRVLLAAVPGRDTLAALSFAVVDQALRAHGTFPPAPGG